MAILRRDWKSGKRGEAGWTTYVSGGVLGDDAMQQEEGNYERERVEVKWLDGINNEGEEGFRERRGGFLCWEEEVHYTRVRKGWRKVDDDQIQMEDGYCN